MQEDILGQGRWWSCLQAIRFQNTEFEFSVAAINAFLIFVNNPFGQTPNPGASLIFICTYTLNLSVA